MDITFRYYFYVSREQSLVSLYFQQVPVRDLIELSLALGEEKKLRGGVVFLDDLPKVSSAKIARHELKQVAKKFIRG